MTPERLSYLLGIWRDWMRRPDHRSDLGYPSTASGIRWRPGGDFDGLIADMDETLAMAVDACVDDLPMMERTAVYVVVIGPMVWRLREPVHEVHERARGMLAEALRRRRVD